MSKASNISSHATSSNSSNPLRQFIKAYKGFLTQRVTDVDDGEKMLELGAKTSTIQEFEQFLLNPLPNLIDIKKNIDSNLMQIVDGFISHFIKTATNSDLIKSAFKKVSQGNSLFYGIILTNDNFENREKVLDFLSFYYGFEFADKIPVYFQFISEELKESFKKVENIA